MPSPSTLSSHATSHVPILDISYVISGRALKQVLAAYLHLIYFLDMQSAKRCASKRVGKASHWIPNLLDILSLLLPEYAQLLALVLSLDRFGLLLCQISKGGRKFGVYNHLPQIFCVQ